MAAGLAIFATSCSTTATNSSHATSVVVTTNTGLCKLVSPSVVATALGVSMSFPETLTHGSTTECLYAAKAGHSQAALIRFDTDTSKSSFIRSEASVERRGAKLGPIPGLGDKAYYFSASARHTSVTTVVLMNGSLQLLVSGSGTVDQIGAIARYTLTQYKNPQPQAIPSSR